MNISQEAVAGLIRTSISGKVASLPDDLNWQEVMDIATGQGVLGLCLDAFERLPEEQRPDIDSMMDWLAVAQLQENNYEHSWQIAQELSALWGEAGITTTLLKGRAIAQYYPIPNHRYSCDLDMFVSDERLKVSEESDWERACELLKAKGVDLVYEVYKEAEFTYDGVAVEFHRYITPVRGNRNLQDFERYLRSLLDAESKTFEGTTLVNPPLLFTELLYVQHALGDFLRGPLTLKHISDWMVLRKQDVDWETFHLRCKEFGFERFLQLVDRLADVVEGKLACEALPTTYRRAYDEIFEPRKTKKRKKGKKSWNERRVSQFFGVLQCYWKYRSFGYCSLPVYLFPTLWTHWFRKEVRLGR